MKDKRLIYAMIEMLLPGLLGATILILIPYHIDVFSSFLVDASQLPSLFPKIAAWAMVLISVVRLIQFAITKKIDLPSVKGIFKPRVLLGLGMLIAYIALLPILGFMIATILCMIAVMYLLGKVAWYKAILFAVICTSIVWYSFVQLLRIPLPSGLWM